MKRDVISPMPEQNPIFYHHIEDLFILFKYQFYNHRTHTCTVKENLVTLLEQQ